MEILTESKSIYPSVKLRFVRDGQVVEGLLHPDIVQQLLDDQKPAQGKWRGKAKNISGRHLVLRVLTKTENQPQEVVWFKFNPEQPGTEYLVQKVDQFLGGFATPPQQLARITVGDQAAIPVLISQEVAPPVVDLKASMNLAHVLMYHPEYLEKISPLSFVSTLLRVLIIQPEDDKANDYFLVPDPDKPGYFLLIRIDNERAFFSPEYVHEGWLTTHSELNVKSIIFCLEQMTASWEALVEKDVRLASYREHIQRLTPAECFQTLLREASDLHDQWCLLFSEAEVRQMAQTGLARGEIVFPLMMILPDCEKALLERLYLIQQAWYINGVSGLPLLSCIQPDLYKYYHPLFKPKTDTFQRFTEGPGKLYQRDEHGQPRTTLSGVISLSRQLNLMAILKVEKNSQQQQQLLGKLIQHIWQRQQYSATQALHGVGSWQQKKVLRIEKNLLMVAGTVVKDHKVSILAAETLPLKNFLEETTRTGKAIPGATMTSRSSTLQQLPVGYRRITAEEAAKLRLSAQLQFQVLPIADRSALLQRVSRLFAAAHPKEPTSQRLIAQHILTLLIQTSVEKLSLTPFGETLTEKQLVSILKCAGPQLLTLDISHCKAVTSHILLELTIYCPNLRYLKARGLPWLTATIEHWLHLKSLDLSQSRIQMLTLRDLPQLTQLKLKQCKSLSVLANIQTEGKITVRHIITAWELPKLQQLDIRDCIALTEIQIITPPKNLLQFDWSNCHPQILVNWLQFLNAKEQEPSEKLELLFTEFNAVLTKKSGVLDLSQINLNGILLKNLGLLLKWNLPVTRLIINEDNDYDFLLKVTLLGAAAVGKSCLVDRFTRNTFDLKSRGTICVEFATKSVVVNESIVKLQIWDTAGLEFYFTTILTYCRNARVFIICIDVSREDSWKKAEYWINYVRKNEPSACAILVGTKRDRSHMRQISQEAAESYARQYNLPYFECSALADSGVKELFLYAASYYKGRFITDKFTEIYSPEEHRETTLIEALQHNKTLLSFEKTRYTSSANQEKIESLIARNRKLAGLTSDQDDKKGLSEDKLNKITLDSSNLTTSLPLLSEDKINITSSSSSKNIFDRVSSFDIIPKELKTISHLLPDDALQLTEIVQPLTEINPSDELGMVEALRKLPIISDNSCTLWKGGQYDAKHLPDSKATVIAHQTLKQLCLNLQYRQRSLIASHFEVKSETAIPRTQAYIQAHPALQQYHDLFLETLEFSIKAAMLGVTGRLTMSNTTDTIVSGIGSAVGIIPGVGNLLKSPFVAMELANKVKMRRQDDQISQLFNGGRDVEAKVAELAEQVTLALRDELLDGKRTPQRQAAHEKSGISGFYQRNKKWLSQKKTEILNWQTLSDPQKQALADAEYLLTELPALATASPHYRGASVNVSKYLQILMHDPDYHYDAKAITADLPETELITVTNTSLPPELLQDKHYYWTSRQQACQATLRQQATQPLTKEQWQALQATLEELELASLEIAQTQEAITTEDELSRLLSDWFDRLQQMPTTPAAVQPTATPEKTEVKSITVPLLPPSPTPDTPTSTPPDPMTTDSGAVTIPTPKAHLTTWLESSTLSRRLKQYVNNLLKTAPADDSDISIRVTWLVDTITVLQQPAISQQLPSQEVSQLMTYLQQLHTQYKPTGIITHLDSSHLPSPSRCAESLFHAKQTLEKKSSTVEEIPVITPISAAPPLVFNSTTGQQMLKTLRRTSQTAAFLLPHTQESNTLRLVLCNPEKGARQYNLSYLNDHWVYWTGRPGTFYPALEKRSDPLSADAQATLLFFVTKELHILSKLCQFSELTTLLCPENTSEAYCSTIVTKSHDQSCAS